MIRHRVHPDNPQELQWFEQPNLVRRNILTNRLRRSPTIRRYGERRRLRTELMAVSYPYAINQYRQRTLNDRQQRWMRYQQRYRTPANPFANPLLRAAGRRILANRKNRV